MTGILIGWFLRANSVFIDGNIDELNALKNRVLLCSPLTLYNVLSLIYQPTRNFALEEKVEELLKLLEKFRAQWSRHAMQMDKLGRNIESTKKDFELLLGTRSRQQKKPLNLNLIIYLYDHK